MTEKKTNLFKRIYSFGIKKKSNPGTQTHSIDIQKQELTAKYKDTTDQNIKKHVSQNQLTDKSLSLKPEIKVQHNNWLQRLRSGLSRSSTKLTDDIASLLIKRKLDDTTLQNLEDILLQADLGIKTTENIISTLSAKRYDKNINQQQVKQVMAEEIEKVLLPLARPLSLDMDKKPHVILLVGVNGAGKTTTIGKLAAKLRNDGITTSLVAGDTFRAAAVEQLKVWGERTGSPVISGSSGTDPAGLAFDAYNQTKKNGYDVMLIDTAGRLQNKNELMAELEKIIRVLRKQDPHAPHTVLLTLDATTGQNAINQVEIFKKFTGVNGLIMTKLDGTARGGILVAVSAKFALPIYFLGVGEKIEDLQPFTAQEFANSIVGS